MTNMHVTLKFIQVRKTRFFKSHRSIVTSLWVKRRGRSITGLRTTCKYSTRLAERRRKNTHPVRNHSHNILKHISKCLHFRDYLLNRRTKQERLWTVGCSPDFQTGMGTWNRGKSSSLLTKMYVNETVNTFIRMQRKLSCQRQQIPQ